MTGLVFLHGWGFGPSTWDAWLPAFPGAPTVVLDAGYFGPSSAPVSAALPHNPDGWLGIGHSQGFAKLAAMAVPWRGLMGLGGFLHFCPTNNHPAGTSRDVLDAMIARLETDAVDVLKRFHRRCGGRDLAGSRPEPEGLARLRADLIALRDLDASPPACPTLYVHAQDDRIAPVALAQEALARSQAHIQAQAHIQTQELNRHTRLALLETGGHALPLTRAAECIALAQEFHSGLC